MTFIPDSYLDPEGTRLDVIQDAYRDILDALGYDLSDEHVKRTPERAALAMWGFRENSNEDVVKRLLDVSFDSQHDSLVQVRRIRVTSMCAHHMLPVQGQAWVGYIPDGAVCGLSKLSRLVEHYGRQLTVQERLTTQIVEAIDRELSPKGVMCVIKATHGCMTLRGVLEDESSTATSAVRGVFLTDPDARAEFLALMRED